MSALGRETPMVPTEHQLSTTTKLTRISQLSGSNRDRTFECLMHHINRETLTACFHELDRMKAVGVDKVTKEDYGANLDANLNDLLERMKRMAYRPGASRQVLIPKDGKPGATRPLAINNFEDKLVARAMSKVLESVYEPIFLRNSFGFRPGRGCHDAILALHNYLFSKPVTTVIDVDLANYFGSIKSEQLLNILQTKVKDDRFLRYIKRILKAGVLIDGELTVSEEGVPQGSPISPILANTFAHYVIDEWFENTVKLHCHEQVEIFRYCDDMVICCNSQMDAHRIKVALGKRLAKYGLTMNEDKTKLIQFSKHQAKRGEQQGIFDFLGFTFYLGKSSKGFRIPKVKSSSKRLRAKLKRVTLWARQNRSRMSLKDFWNIFRIKIQGHINYYAVSFNRAAVKGFVLEATRIVFKWLNRRGGRRKLTWEKFLLFISRHPLPKISIKHHLFARS